MTWCEVQKIAKSSEGCRRGVQDLEKAQTKAECNQVHIRSEFGQIPRALGNRVGIEVNPEQIVVI